MPIETPGVWEVVPITKGGGYWVQLSGGAAGFDDDVVVCKVEGRRPKDAAMIAAAPELYDALVELMNAVGRPEGPGTDMDAWTEAEAAVAKARGEFKG